MSEPTRTRFPDVVVTGVGVVSPAGGDASSSFAELLAGTPHAAVDPELVAAGTSVVLSCRSAGVDADALLGRGSTRRLDPFTHLALRAAHEALAHAGLAVGAAGGALDLTLQVTDPDRVGVVLGSGIGGAETWSAEYPNVLTKGYDRASPFFVPRMLSNTAAGTVAIRTGARGPNLTVNTACAAGASAIHVARDLIRSGSADVVIAGGVEAGITPLAVAAFANMGALTRNDDAAHASRPFDVARDGFVMGEGAGILVLESAEHAARRGATVLGRVAGAGASADAHHATAPPADGAGAALAIRRALADAGLDAADIGHVNAHGTSTPANDVAEAHALRTVLGDHLDRVPVTSIKGSTGHLLGAAGAVEAAVALLSLAAGTAPPTAGTSDVDPEIDLDVVLDAPRAIDADRAVLSTSFGFGGQNAALVLTA